MAYGRLVCGLTAAVLLTLSTGIALARQADPVFNVMHSFCAGTTCKKGQQGSGYPAPLVQYAPDRFIGTAEYGGAHLQGVLYEIDRTASGYKYTILHSFCGKAGCSDGAEPSGSLVVDEDGDIYGTTLYGGVTNQNCSYRGCGTAYELMNLDSTGTKFQFKLLYNFCKNDSTCSRGAAPRGLTYEGAASGQPYSGTSPMYGVGSYYYGDVFVLTPPDGVHRTNWSSQVIYGFCSRGGSSCTDGFNPNPGLLVDSGPTIYGSTSSGGKDFGGVVFKIDSAFSETVLHSFDSGSTGPWGPEGNLVKDGDGNLYGTSSGGPNGSKGTVFELSPRRTGYRLTMLYAFCSEPNCTDGANPRNGLTMDSFGLLYGVTFAGGVAGGNSGVVFRVKPKSGVETVLHAFCGGGSCADGDEPVSPLIVDDTGHLIGVTTYGGDAGDGGVAFDLLP